MELFHYPVSLCCVSVPSETTELRTNNPRLNSVSLIQSRSMDMYIHIFVGEKFANEPIYSTANFSTCKKKKSALIRLLPESWSYENFSLS